MRRLNEESLREQGVPADVGIRGYARHGPEKVLHIGVGAFHKAHQAAYFDALNEQLTEPWLIRGASLRRATAGSELNPQDGLFLHVARSSSGCDCRVIRSLTGVISGLDDLEELLARIAHGQTQLLTLTITEKGYALDPATRALDATDPAVAADLQSLATPRTAIGVLVAGLRRRREEDTPLTVLSCDNLPDNGALCRDAVLTLAAHHEPGLADWIRRRVSFPASMVDRIAPASTDVDLRYAERMLGLKDLATVSTESFSQWVIEDNFAGERPPLQRVGVSFVESVTAWELRKLRMLNAAHSALAYLGGLADCAFVHEAVDDASLVSTVRSLWVEVLTTLPSGADFDASEYTNALLERFRNPSLKHRLQQIAEDGSQKLPQRILAPLGERLAAGQASPALTSVVAAWLHWQWGESFSGAPVAAPDPQQKIFQAAIAGRDRWDRAAYDALLRSYKPLATLLSHYPAWAEVLRTAYTAMALHKPQA